MTANEECLVETEKNAEINSLKHDLLVNDTFSNNNKEDNNNNSKENEEQKPLKKVASFDLDNSRDIDSLFSDLSSVHSDKLDVKIETPKENKLDEFSTYIHEKINEDLNNRQLFTEEVKDLTKEFIDVLRTQVVPLADDNLEKIKFQKTITQTNNIDLKNQEEMALRKQKEEDARKKEEAKKKEEQKKKDEANKKKTFEDSKKKKAMEEERLKKEREELERKRKLEEEKAKEESDLDQEQIENFLDNYQISKPMNEDVLKADLQGK